MNIAGLENPVIHRVHGDLDILEWINPQIKEWELNHGDEVNAFF